MRLNVVFLSTDFKDCNIPETGYDELKKIISAVKPVVDTSL